LIFSAADFTSGYYRFGFLFPMPKNDKTTGLMLHSIKPAKGKRAVVFCDGQGCETVQPVCLFKKEHAMIRERNLTTILNQALEGVSINKEEAEALLALPENSLEAAMVRATANQVSRKKFKNQGLLLGQLGVDVGPCIGDCKFCFFAKSNTTVKPSVLSMEEITQKCLRFAQGGAQGIFLMTMHHFGYDWFLQLCTNLRKLIPESVQILANVGDLKLTQMKELRKAGVSGAYHVCRLREGIDSCMTPMKRRRTIEHIIEAGLDWYNQCEPVGPEHTPHELAEQIWLGVDLPCKQHGVQQRFPVAGSALEHYGQILLQKLGLIVAVVALATQNKQVTTSISVNVSNMVGLFSGANAFFPEDGEPDRDDDVKEEVNTAKGFTTALWRKDKKITTAACRKMFSAAGFSGLMSIDGKPMNILF
jgi:biotin synthase